MFIYAAADVCAYDIYNVPYDWTTYLLLETLEELPCFHNAIVSFGCTRVLSRIMGRMSRGNPSPPSR